MLGGGRRVLVALFAVLASSLGVLLRFFMLANVMQMRGLEMMVGCCIVMSSSLMLMLARGMLVLRHGDAPFWPVRGPLRRVGTSVGTRIPDHGPDLAALLIRRPSLRGARYTRVTDRRIASERVEPCNLAGIHLRAKRSPAGRIDAGPEVDSAGHTWNLRDSSDRQVTRATSQATGI